MTVDGQVTADLMVTGQRKIARKHHLMGSVGVQARGGLIQEEHPGVGDQRNANVGSLCLQEAILSSASAGQC